VAGSDRRSGTGSEMQARFLGAMAKFGYCSRSTATTAADHHLLLRSIDLRYRSIDTRYFGRSKGAVSIESHVPLLWFVIRRPASVEAPCSCVSRLPRPAAPFDRQVCLFDRQVRSLRLIANFGHSALRNDLPRARLTAIFSSPWSLESIRLPLRAERGERADSLGPRQHDGQLHSTVDGRQNPDQPLHRESRDPASTKIAHPRRIDTEPSRRDGHRFVDGERQDRVRQLTLQGVEGILGHSAR